MSPWARPSRAVFVDSAAFYPLTDRSSIDHRSAQSVLERLVADRRTLLTTNFVVAETHALVLTRLGRRVARGFLEWIDQSAVVVVRVGVADERRARVIVDTYDDKDYTDSG
jgi:uncharacterized protein